ncbi:MAG: putative n-terminal acetyltransferase [Armatimonadetes bacterium]|jgi:ribosomal protein S18 acetylase RimI-like enzyme|nr:putative n-terminal acetyltransferase [Armatimonadota bacterium]
MLILDVPFVNRLLERCGVIARWRAGMTLDLSRLTEPPVLPEGYEIVEWDPARLPEIAWVDHLAYRDTLDARLYWQYFSTPAGCELMWREALEGKFGRFDAQRTLILIRDGRVCGDIMASIRNPSEGFVGNLAVSPEHRGGTGRALLLSCLWRFRDAGFERVSLAVTLDNQPAYRLYSRLGFVMNNRFPLVARPAQRL